MRVPGKLSWYYWPLGVTLGLLAAFLVMPLLDKDEARAESTVGPILSDCDGALRELVIQYTPDSAEIVAAPYRDFLTQLPEAVTVHVVCRDRAAFDELAGHVGEVRCRLHPVFADHPMTSWSRDRWIALEPAGDATAFTLLSPRGEMGADAWPERKGDEGIGDDLAGALANLDSARSELYFDGGDFVCDHETAFVTPNVRLRNLQVTVKTEIELLRRLREITGRTVVLLEDAPDHHAGMYMMTLGERRVMVGDPSMAKALLTDAEIAALPLPYAADFSAETQALFDSVAEQCRNAGYEVIRVPVGPCKDGRTFLTTLNSVLDERDGQRTVYMPVIDGARKLNEAAEKVWREAGFEVRRVNCTTCYRWFGSLRCLVNVSNRG
ncbi:MAG: hypothetical protein K8I27_03410 [Planctomycetes bacterium]|nr:hypothetical protein [Planctomycetota bacterium]